MQRMTLCVSDPLSQQPHSILLQQGKRALSVYACNGQTTMTDTAITLMNSIITGNCAALQEEATCTGAADAVIPAQEAAAEQVSAFPSA